MYSTKEKQIYKTADGALTVDPLEVRRKLTIHSGGKLQELIDAFNDGATELVKAQAEESLVAVARTAFGVKPVAAGGTCDATVLEYLASYLEWLSMPSEPTVKAFLSSSPCTDCPPPSIT